MDGKERTSGDRERSRGWAAQFNAGSMLQRFALLAVSSYGTLYFSYKWYALYDPDFLTFYARNDLNPLNFSSGATPHTLRQGSAIVTWLIYHLDLYYPDAAAFHSLHVDQRLFFAALLGNYVGLLFAATFAGSINQRDPNGGYSILAGLLCLASFAAQSFVITGNTEGVTWAVVALLFVLTARESRVLFAAIVFLSIFQREMITVLFGAFAAFSMNFDRGRSQYWLFVLATCLISFAAYVLLREIVIPGNQDQLNPMWIAANIRATHIERSVILQALLSQNLIILVLGLAVIARLRGSPTPPGLPQLLLTFFVLLLAGVIEGEMAGDLGRICAMLTPAFASYASASLAGINSKGHSA